MLLIILGSTALFNIMFMLHTASNLTDGVKEPARIPPVEHSVRNNIQKEYPKSVPSALYWMKDKVSNGITGKILKHQWTICQNLPSGRVKS